MNRFERMFGGVFLSSLAIGLATMASQDPPTTRWRVRVVDAVTGVGVPGMAVEVRSKALAAAGHLVKAETDGQGRAVLEHDGGFSAVESVIALGDDAYHYTSRSDTPGLGETSLYVIPYSAFWKSPMIPASTGTGGAPMVHVGQCNSPLGALPVTFEVAVPPGVLPADCQIWVALRPVHQAVNNDTPLDQSPAHFGQLHVQLRSADGSVVITDQLREPGIQVSVTPFWLPASTFPIDDNVVVRRLNTETLVWDTVTPKGRYTMATGKATFTLRAFSCIDICSERYGNALCGNPDQATNPPTPVPPVQDLPQVVWEDCLRPMTPAVNVPVVCCVYQANGSTQVQKGTTVAASASTSLDIMSNFNITLGDVGKLLAKINFGSSSKIAVSGTQSLETTYQKDEALSVVQGTPLASCQCMTGTCRICGLAKKATLKRAGCQDVEILAYEGLGMVYCLKYVECAAGCNAPGPHVTHVENQPGQKICADGWPECKD